MCIRDSFIITGRDKELLENEVKPIVIEFLKERGLTLSEEKTTITNIYDCLLYTSHKGCKQESLIRMLNAKIRGWGAYYQHGATRDSFHRIDHQIFLALWQWAKRRHSKKGKQWIKDRYWHNIRGNSWTFAAKFKRCV